MTSLFHTNARYDPTRTITLRKQYEAEMVRRFKALRKEVRETILLSQPMKVNAFEFTRSPRKVPEFMKWIQQRVDFTIFDGVTDISTTNKAWQNVYIRTAYQKGIASAAGNLRGAGAEVSDRYISSAFYRPLHADRAGLLYTRAYSDLQGITAAMSTKMGRVLAAGILDGKGVRDIADELVDVINGVGIVRARMIARTEVIASHAEASLNVYEEAKLKGVNLHSEFSTARDNKVCPQCEKLEGKTYSVSEARGLIPVHPNCFLPGTRVSGSFIGGLKSLYSGPALEIKTSKGHRLQVTPNHPILTPSGWVPAKRLREGHQLFSQGGQVGHSISVDNNYGPAPIEEVFQSLRSRGLTPIQPGSLDLHGDAAYSVGHIDIVGALGLAELPTQMFRQRSLVLADMGRSNLFGQSPCGKCGGSILAATTRSPSSRALFTDVPSFFNGQPLQPLRLGPAANWDVTRSEKSHQMSSTDPAFLRDLIERSAGEITLDVVSEVRSFTYEGHVYDLQSLTGWYLSQGITVSNCRCAWLPVVEDPEDASLF